MDKNINLTPIRKIRNDFQPNEVMVYKQPRKYKSMDNYMLWNNETESQTSQSLYTYDISDIPSKYKATTNTDNSNRSSSNSHSTKQKVLNENLHIVQEQNFEIKGDIKEIDNFLIDRYTIETQSEHNTEDQIQQKKIEYQNNLKHLYQKINKITNKLKQLEKNNIQTKKQLSPDLTLNNTTKKQPNNIKTQNKKQQKKQQIKKENIKKTNIIQIEQKLDKMLLQYDAPKKHTNIVIEYEKAKDNYLFYGGSYKKYKELEKQYKLWLNDELKKDTKNIQKNNKLKNTTNIPTNNKKNII